MNQLGPNVGTVISVNVGQPRLAQWRGQQIRTAIWKYPVRGRVMARHLNLDGDGQADLNGHGGENRAMLVYQVDSYRYWQQLLGDAPYEMGWFGENLTVEGLADTEVCIGDRFRIGDALVEVTQPRVTCYRLGVRTGRAEMPSLLVQHGRPGFYVRVLEEGAIGASDPIELTKHHPAQMSVTSVDQLLYLAEHPVEELRRALSIDALSDGWKESFRELLNAQQNDQMVGNPGLSQGRANEAWQGFKSLLVLSNTTECSDVKSIVLGLPDGKTLPRFAPGQHIVLKTVGMNRRPLIRTYSLSGPPGDGVYRISIKREAGGVGSGYLQDWLQPGSEVDSSAPRGTFTLDSDATNPIVLLSAGIGVTPLLSMLHGLASTTRKVFWVHGAQDGDHLGFRDEIRMLLSKLRHPKRLIAFSQPSEHDVLGDDYDFKGRLNIDLVRAMDLPKDTDFYLCGPSSFLQVFRDDLSNWGVFPSRIHFESFGPSASNRPTSSQEPTTDGDTYQVTLTRSNRVLKWNGSQTSLLELAEAEHIPVQWSCRVGVCHSCETGLLDGAFEYSPTPLDAPPSGRILICCARPKSDLTLDL